MPTIPIEAKHEKAVAVWLLIGLVALLAGRLWLMWILPLTDTTEARYGEIARLTAEMGFWLMPHSDPLTPFFAKPALSTWLEAASCRILGTSELALRLPALLATLATMALVWTLLADRPLKTRLFGLLAFASAPLMFVSAGTVMTDPVHMLCIAVAMVAAWRVLFDATASRGMHWMFWAAVGVGMLAKGLATVALIALPLGLYALVSGRLREVVSRILSIRGILLALIIAVPWYLIAEMAYPGFLNYFLIGEHFRRFTDPGWTGDRYGFAHKVPLGMIWLFWLGAVGPWAPVFFMHLTRLVRIRPIAGISQDARWWWSWCLAPLLFFTFSRNAIWTYALTAIPPFAMLAAQWFDSRSQAFQVRLAGSSLILILASLAAMLWWLPAEVGMQSARTLVEQARRRAGIGTLVCAEVYPFSADYYTRRQLVRADSAGELDAWLKRPGSLIILPVNRLPAAGVTEIARNNKAVLVEVGPASARITP